MQKIRFGKPSRKPTAAVRALCAVACASAAPAVLAVDLNPGGEWETRWDNTVKYSGGYRLRNPAPGSMPNINLDDGNRAFNKGLMSNRVDLLSEFDIQRRGVGFRASAAAWYDTVYNQGNDNTSALTANQFSVPANQFTAATRDVAGRKVEVLDLFAFGQTDLGETHRLSYRVGQYSLLWGNSLFFAANGIAKGMAPVDVLKLNVPGTQAKETLLPVPQLSATLNLTDRTSVEGYYQLKFRPTRLAPAGSYFSATDWLGDGGERFLFAPNFGMTRGPDIKGSGEHNFGVSLNTRSELLETDFGIHALRYQDTSPQTVMQPAVGRYYVAYPQNVRLAGVSFARLLGDANVSGELSHRWGQPLSAINGANTIGSPAANAAALDLANNSMWPTGRTLHLNLSTVWILSSSPYWGGASLIGEFMANRVLHVDHNANHIDPTKSRSSAAFRAIFTPTYYQVVPGLDLSPSLNVGWSLRGNSMIDGGALPFAGSPDKGGDVVLGLSGTYLNKYTFNVSWINYVGHADTQPFLNRDYVRISLQTTF